MSRALRAGSTVAAGLVRGLLAAAEEAGIDTAEVLAAEGLSPEVLVDADARVPYDTLMALTERVSARSQDPFFGLNSAKRYIDAAQIGVVGFALRSSSTLGEAINRLARYSAIVNENSHIELVVSGERATVFNGPFAPLCWPRHHAEMAIGAIHVLSERWTGEDVTPLHVGFQHPAPRDVRPIEAFFGCAVDFGQRTNTITLATRALSLPFRDSDLDLTRFIDRQLDSMLAALRAAPGGLAVVRRAVLSAMSSGRPELGAIAHALSLTPRTLQRRLRAEGTTFAQLVESVQKEVALKAIAQPRTSVQEVAFLCGFSDLRAFRRAFQRWTGKSPSRLHERGEP